MYSTDMGWLNKPMVLFLEKQNLDRIIHPVGRPSFTAFGIIEYQYTKKI